MTATAPIGLARPAAAAVLAGGSIGLIAALALTVERYKLLTDPQYVPSCSLNPVISCGSVMTTPQAAVLGFPNPILGLAAFPVVVVTGVLTVAAIRLPRWYWYGLAAGIVAGTAFVHWLIFESLYRIGALCPYCMAVWVVVVPLSVIAVTAALQSPRPGPVRRFLHTWRWTIVTFWYTALVLVILDRFWNYWSTRW
ncbi:vitamin K epoxide reductase [Rhodococcus opacus]|uniref:Vitamin K epoxide reductase n=1 Tax=Rhodococcus opacus TaxID=37919 RepID=A0A1B1K7R7_RHOOP|nr:vitamin K epoxide reductase family protein [Rhodococcus opacus]ANS28670.1 vitamin K epoxide reductase [Rhodococcus opacus]